MLFVMRVEVKRAAVGFEGLDRLFDEPARECPALHSVTHALLSACAHDGHGPGDLTFERS
jgi:hypothetical protein